MLQKIVLKRTNKEPMHLYYHKGYMRAIYSFHPCLITGLLIRRK